MHGRQRFLVVMLRVGGCLTGSALLAVFLPTAWMASIHQAIGLGEYPDAPLVEYLARTLSGLYALHGGLLLVMSTDVRRYSPLLVYFGLATAIFGLIAWVVDVQAGLPGWWVVVEGPPVVAIGLTVAWLARGLPSNSRG